MLPSCLWTIGCWTTALQQSCLYDENLASSLHLEQWFAFQSFHTFSWLSKMVCQRPCRLANRTSWTLALGWPFSQPISLINANTIIYHFLLSYFTISGRAPPPCCAVASCPDLSSLLPSFGVETNCGLNREGSDSWEKIWEAVMLLCVPIWLVSSLPLTYYSYHQHHVVL